MKYFFAFALLTFSFSSTFAQSQDPSNPLRQRERQQREYEEIAAFNRGGTDAGEAIYRAWYIVNDPCYYYSDKAVWGLSLYGQQRCDKTYIGRAFTMSDEAAVKIFLDACYSKIATLCKKNEGWRAFGKY